MRLCSGFAFVLCLWQVIAISSKAGRGTLEAILGGETESNSLGLPSSLGSLGSLASLSELGLANAGSADALEGLGMASTKDKPSSLSDQDVSQENVNLQQQLDEVQNGIVEKQHALDSLTKQMESEQRGMQGSAAGDDPQASAQLLKDPDLARLPQFLAEQESAAHLTPKSEPALLETGGIHPETATQTGLGVNSQRQKVAEGMARFQEARGGAGMGMGIGWEGQEGPEDNGVGALQSALKEIQADILRNGHDLIAERNWIKDVERIIGTYLKKVKRVSESVDAKRDKLKALVRKKRLIQNLILQKKLESKLADAKSDLSSLQSAMTHVMKKHQSFSKDRASILGTIQELQTQLRYLRGGTHEAESGSAVQTSTS